VPSIRFLGVRIDCLRLDGLLSYAVAPALTRGQSTILYVNVHCMNLRSRDAAYARILEEADVVYCDGTGVRLGAYLAGLPIPERMTGADWIDPLCRRMAAHGLSLFLLGGASGSAAEAAAVLQRRHPALRIAGTAQGYDVSKEVIATINRARPDILLVGMGTPRQEKWIDRHRPELEVPVVWAVGALFDFVNGRIRRGPRWMTEHGLEWLCRLAVEPGKLWRRYLIGNPQFLWRVVKEYWLRPRRH
jgi:N-acetylglucosaminyldiphosphoundecaprenol N-acetyl-beta-D-mannosaminyltransferase